MVTLVITADINVVVMATHHVTNKQVNVTVQSPDGQEFSVIWVGLRNP